MHLIQSAYEPFRFHGYQFMPILPLILDAKTGKWQSLNSVLYKPTQIDFIMTPVDVMRNEQKTGCCILWPVTSL